MRFRISSSPLRYFALRTFSLRWRHNYPGVRLFKIMKRTKFLGIIVLSLILLPMKIWAWGDTGHMVVAQIAFENLDSEAKRARVNELAALIQFNDRDYEFVTSACWMDDIRDAPMFEPLKDWHFITQRYIIDGAVPDEPPPPVNIASIIKWLGHRLKSKSEPDLKKAYYLAQITHLIGDIHQPLHCATRFTPGERDGDRGGNYFSLGEEAKRKNLHSYWDAAGGFFAFRDVGRPLTNSRRETLQRYATRLTELHPKATMLNESNRLSPTAWAGEGLAIAKSDVYVGIVEDSVPDNNYEEKTRRISARRMTLAGYRLAKVLNIALD